jgi:phospholipase C
VAGDEANPDGLGHEVARYPETRYCVCSPGHEWSEAHLQYDAGLMDGFVATSNPSGGRAMGYYSEDELPFSHFLGRHFAISARHFSSLLGPTEPNRLFYYVGTSCNFADDFKVNPPIVDCGEMRTTLFDLLDTAGVSYRIYDASNVSMLLNALRIQVGWPGTIEDFERDAARGDLAAVSIVGASTGELTAPSPSNDDHPPANPRAGQVFLSRIVRALSTPPSAENGMKSPWDTSALFVSYDEHGGYYDHVPPPKACDPEESSGRDYDFDQLGFRVPLIVVSPWAKPGYVSRHDTDHTSVLRFIEHWKDLPALTRRDANAWPLLDLFDFEQTPLPAPTLHEEWSAATTITVDACPAQCATGVDPAPI